MTRTGSSCPTKTTPVEVEAADSRRWRSVGMQRWTTRRALRLRSGVGLRSRPVSGSTGRVTARTGLPATVQTWLRRTLPRDAPGDIPPHRYTAALAEQIESAWQERWTAKGTFHAPNPERRAGRGLRGRRRAAQVLRPRHVPVPERRGAPRRPPARLHRHRRLRPVQADDRAQRAAHDGLRRLRAARRAVRGRDGPAPPHHHRRQHRQHGPPARAPRVGSRRPTGRGDHRRVVLPLDPVDLPAALQRLVRRRGRPGAPDRRARARARRGAPRTGGGHDGPGHDVARARRRRASHGARRASPGVHLRGPGQLVPRARHGARERGGQRRGALGAGQLPRVPPPAAAVDAAHHGLRGASARRPRRCSTGPSRSSSCSATGSDAPREPRCCSRPTGTRPPSRCSPPGRTPSSAPPTWSSPPSTSWSRPTRRRRGPKARRPSGPEAPTRRPRRSRPTSTPPPGAATATARAKAARRPACSPAPSRSTPSTATRSRSSSPTTSSPATAPGRSWRCRPTTSATSSSPGLRPARRSRSCTRPPSWFTDQGLDPDAPIERWTRGLRG